MSQELEALVMRALAPFREDRPGSADGMREQLLQCPIEVDAAFAAQRAERSPCDEDDPADGRSELLERLAPTPAGARRDRPSAIPAPVRPSAGSRTPIDPGVLEAVEQRALALLGPLAPILLRRASVDASTVEELVQKLAGFAPSEAERKALLAPYSTSRATPARTPSRVEWDPTALERIQRHLAAYIGPVARIVVQRASIRAGGPSELHEIVAREIADADDRKAFLASVATPDASRST